MLAFLCLLGAAAAQDFKAFYALTPERESVVDANLPWGETRDQYFGLYMHNLSPRPLALKQVNVIAWPSPTCQLRTRDLTGVLRQVKQPAINVFDSEKTRFFKEDNSYTVGRTGVHYGKRLVAYGSQRYTPIDPRKRYRIDTSSFDKGARGELAVNLAVVIKPRRGKCLQCKISGVLRDENNVRYDIEPMFIYRRSGECAKTYNRLRNQSH